MSKVNSVKTLRAKRSKRLALKRGLPQNKGTSYLRPWRTTNGDPVLNMSLQTSDAAEIDILSSLNLRNANSTMTADHIPPQHIPSRKPSHYTETLRYATSPKDHKTLRHSMLHMENYNIDYNSYSKSIDYGDSRLKWLKSFKFDIDDSKAQFTYFEERLADHGIIENAEKYWVIREFWPNKDMSDYTLCTAPKDRNFGSLRKYLIEKDGVCHRFYCQRKNLSLLVGTTSTLK